jgi:A/G-specific adenine glycosylase
VTSQRQVVTRLRAALLAFYRRRGRDLPWRRTTDPYAVWVSEIMLQQTQVETVRPRFSAFMRQFPDVASLARVPEASVCEAWAGLGYYRRARHLHRAARVVVDEHGGKLPSTRGELGRLPGIGDYTAAAVASIAFGERVPAVDGNLVRVLARVFALPGRVGDPALLQAVRLHAEALVDCGRPGDVNQALMDVGAMVCRPAGPACASCPLRGPCQAHREGRPLGYPGKRPPTPRKALRVAFAWCTRDGRVLLEQRPLDGLWPGLWELPSAHGPAARQALAERLGQPLGRPLARVTHELTHRRVTAGVYPSAGVEQPGRRFWAEPLSAPLSALARKAIVAVQARGEGR